MTLLQGPYDDLPHRHKHRVATGLPDNVYERLFLTAAPLRGAQDKILARFLDALHDHLDQHQLLTFPDPNNEVILNDILNSIIFTHVPNKQEPSRSEDVI